MLKNAVRVGSMLVLGGLAACSGAGPYGHARTYVETDAERGYVARAEEPVYDEVRRMPEQYQGRLLTFFGVVTDVAPGPEGTLRVALQQRTHQERHLCEDESDGTCRVTINARDGGPLTAVLSLRGEDRDGERRLQQNSLVRVFGSVTPGEYDANGGPVLRVEWYRHWPRGEYVTTQSAGVMRR
ncbi:MAG: hypothetical protein JNK72_06070 [Myxococcales bacterium]|nr:hypothetical protein [Myxococcales bacterium]